MAWFRVDDNLPFHAKVVAAGNAAMGLWVRAGAWSMQQLTDGFVPSHIAKTLGTPAEIAKLVTVGLWVKRDAATGYDFWEWHGRQPTRAQVEADREAAKERQRKARERAKERRDAERDTPAPSRRDNGVSHEAVTPVVTVPPTRPDPTRPITALEDLAPAPPTPIESRRPPDPLWDAVMAACKIDTASITASARGGYNRAVGDLRKIGADPGDVPRRAARFRQQWPNVSLTPTALAKQWAACSAATVNGAGPAYWRDGA